MRKRVTNTPSIPAGAGLLGVFLIVEGAFVIKQKALELKKKIAAVFMAMKKKETPFYAKIVAMITIAYALSPIDLIPDFIPVLGYLDDLILLPLLIALTLKLIPKEIMSVCEEEAKNLWNDGKPKKWFYAIPIVIIWLLIAVIVICNIKK